VQFVVGAFHQAGCGRGGSVDGTPVAKSSWLVFPVAASSLTANFLSLMAATKNKKGKKTQSGRSGKKAAASLLVRVEADVVGEADDVMDRPFAGRKIDDDVAAPTPWSAQDSQFDDEQRQNH
jgi:hypothetical protein